MQAEPPLQGDYAMMRTQAPGTEMADTGEQRTAAAQEARVPRGQDCCQESSFFPRCPGNCLVGFLVDLWPHTTVSCL